MDKTTTNTAGWKQKARRELIAYWITFAYLAVFFGAFYAYRRLVLAHYDISFLNYGIALLKALVLAKVILIGDALRFGKSLEGTPLIYSTLGKALLFTLWVAVFTLLEHTITGWIHTHRISAGWTEIRAQGFDVLVAQSLMVFVALLPFFAIKELGRALGEGKVSALFFQGRQATASTPGIP